MKEKNLFKYLLPFLITIVFLIGFFGSWQYYSNPIFSSLSVFNRFCACLSLTLQLFTLGTDLQEDIVPVLLNVSRFISPLLLAGAILNLIFNITKEKLVTIKVKNSYQNHIIFCGLSQNAILLIDDYLKHNPGIKIVVISNSDGNQYVSNIKNRSVVVIKGNALDRRAVKGN